MMFCIKKGQFTVFEAEKSTRTTTNGAGCTLSSAITAMLAKGTSLEVAIQTAKAFVWAGIEDGLPLGTLWQRQSARLFLKRRNTYESKKPNDDRYADGTHVCTFFDLYHSCSANEGLCDLM